MKVADSSLDMCLKRDAAADAKKGGNDRGERMEREGGKEGKKEIKAKDIAKLRADISVHTQQNS